MDPDPKTHTVIVDSQFQWPVLNAELERAGFTMDEVRNFGDKEQYEAWCDDVPTNPCLDVGTQECIDICERLIANGCDVWHV